MKYTTFEALELECESLRQQLSDTQETLENEQALGIHSCHKDCSLDGCVNRRLRQQLASRDAEIESLRQQLAEKIELNSQLADFLGDAEKQLADLLEANRIMCEDFAAENNKCSALEQQLAAAHKERDELALIVATDTGTEGAVALLQERLTAMEEKYLVERGMRRLHGGEAESLRQQLSDSQKQVTLLRTKLVKAADFIQPYNRASDLLEELDEALAATEPKL